MKTQRLLFGCQNDHQDTHPDIDLASSLPLLICRSGFSFFSFRRKARQIPEDKRTKLFKALNVGTYPRSCTTMDNHGSTSIADFLTYVPLQPLPPSRSPSPYQHILPSGSPHLFFTFFQNTQTLNYFPRQTVTMKSSPPYPSRHPSSFWIPITLLPILCLVSMQGVSRTSTLLSQLPSRSVGQDSSFSLCAMLFSLTIRHKHCGGV